MRMIVLIPKAIANATVQRLRLRSTSEPPPSGPLPVPTPNAPDRPASFPECMRMRKIRTIAMTTWATARIVKTTRPWYPASLGDLRHPPVRTAAAVRPGVHVDPGERPDVGVASDDVVLARRQIRPVDRVRRDLAVGRHDHGRRRRTPQRQ